MNISQINTAIIQGNFTAEQLESIRDAVKFAAGKTARFNSVTIKVGSQVKITHAKLGGTVIGEVRKVKIKKADVFIPSKNVTYNVPLSMLTAA
jgi:predicted metallo-beta-lactamase superfamily hydrolase